ncbi:BadF/BadG/BcrA/BcrD ATPase family protein [Streptomyces sp. S.PB5]|uniref:N-acetylglucosamine kinase n=1 Tax=Streptomyces sp. S.PB5 TaxID=3020844 RepID=UPI0025B1ED76|nr:BadF/BadG/BcrA/BcrD ATPase family protein [Streptomyces sp. S.PB5]MDN3021605.1 BadF/BadG/BcrA/BcrD ATPase family protein [Streptomyces sp. S.PB5]
MGNDLNQNSGDGLVVGLDAGGTRTRAMCASVVDGRLLGEGAGGPGNALTVPEPQLTDHLTEAIAAAVPESARGRVVAVAGGFAGATGASPADPGYVRARTALTAALGRLGVPPGPVGICSDIEAAFASAPGTPSDGLALVAGTGAVAMRITGRRATTTVDGDGWLLGDDGSGFWIGRSAVRAALRMADGRGPGTALAILVGRALGVPEEALPTGGSSYDGKGGGTSDGSSYDGKGGGTSGWAPARREDYRRHLLPAVMADPPIRLARLAPLVVEAAGEKDAVAAGILAEAADQLTDTVRALEPRPGEPLVATGGLLGPDGPLTAPLATRLHALGLTLDWVTDGCRGAVALARLAHSGGDR